MKNFFEENKKMIIIAGILLALYIVFGIVNSLMSGNGKINPEKALKELGTIYYEELVYPYIMQSDESVARLVIDDYKKEGLKVTLDKLLESIENAKETIFYNDKIMCNELETYIIIYPTGYSKNSYKLETHISC